MLIFDLCVQSDMSFGRMIDMHNTLLEFLICAPLFCHDTFFCSCNVFPVFTGARELFTAVHGVRIFGNEEGRVVPVIIVNVFKTAIRCSLVSAMFD